MKERERERGGDVRSLVERGGEGRRKGEGGEECYEGLEGLFEGVFGEGVYGGKAYFCLDEEEEEEEEGDAERGEVEERKFFGVYSGVGVLRGYYFLLFLFC